MLNISRIHLVIVENSLGLRKSLVEELQNDPEIDSVEDFASAKDFLWKKSLKSEPNIMLLDINLSKFSGTDTIDSILLDYPLLNIIVFSVYGDSSNVMQSLSKGAVGYIQKKQQSVEDIVRAIKIVRDGGSYLSPFVTRRIVNLFRPSRLVASNKRLTQREEQVLTGLAKGQSYQEIANELIISIDTVRVYIKKIYTKLNVNNKTQLISRLQNLFDRIE